MEDIVIVGSSGLAKEIAFLIEDINKNNIQWNFKGFVDNCKGKKIGKYTVVMNDDELLNFKNEINVIIGIGFPELLKKLANKFSCNKKLIFPNIIHPNCIGDWDRIEFGKGNVLTAGNILTTDIKIGSFNIFNLNGTIGHDATIGNFNVLNPTNNISGNVVIKDEILIGTGVQILQNLKISESVIIGASSVVTRDILESGVYVGAPAKRIK